MATYPTFLSFPDGVKIKFTEKLDIVCAHVTKKTPPPAKDFQCHMCLGVVDAAVGRVRCEVCATNVCGACVTNTRFIYSIPTYTWTLISQHSLEQALGLSCSWCAQACSDPVWDCRSCMITLCKDCVIRQRLERRQWLQDNAGCGRCQAKAKMVVDEYNAGTSGGGMGSGDRFLIALRAFGV